jgi:hypothetical protein
MKAMVTAAVRGEAGGDEFPEDVTTHHHRMPLGLVLLQQGWITQVQLERALYRQRSAGTGRIGRWLTEECGLDREVVTRGLALQWSCPVLRPEGFEPEAMALLAPRVLVESAGMVPLRVVAGSRLYVAFADGVNAVAALAMERITGLKVVSGLMESSQWEAARERLCACPGVETKFEQVGRPELLVEAVADALCRTRPRAARLVRVHHVYWLRMWLESGAMQTNGGGVSPTGEDVLDRLYMLGAKQ